MLVQEARNGASLKIIAGILGTLLCADLATRIPFDSPKPEQVPSPASGVAAPESTPPLPETAPPVQRSAAAAPKADIAASTPNPSVDSPPTTSTTVPPPQLKAVPDAPPQVAASSETAASGGVPCEQQTWPYVDARCNDAGAEAPAPGSRQVRVIGKDSNAPSVVVTPLPNDATAKPPQPPSQVAATQPALSAAPQQSQTQEARSALPQTDQQVSVRDQKAPETAPGTAESPVVALPRPAPSGIRKAGTYSAPPSPAAEDSPVSREQQPRRLKKTKIVREQPVREQPAREHTLATRRTNARARMAEEGPRAHDEESRRAAVQSRAYELPSGRRIVVFRQSNGDVGIAPASDDASSFFFGR